MLVEECKNAEVEFIKNNKISAEKTDSFKNTIFEEIKKGNELTSYLKDNDKYSIISKRSKRLFGFYQIIGRELFFDDVYGLDNIKKAVTPNTKVISIAHITNVIGDVRPIKEICKFAHDNNIFVVVDAAQSIGHIDSLNKEEKYVIITSPSNCRILNLNNFDDKTLDIGPKKIDLIKIPKARDIYLIKKNDLPIVEMLEPDIAESGIHLNGVYYDLIDCSTNASTRNEIQKNTKWLEEKGSVDDQIEYLKGNCVFKLFISPSIRKIPKSKCYKFVIKESDE